MKSFLNSVLLGIIAFIFIFAIYIVTMGNARADTGFFYNPDRSGEGIIVTTDEDRKMLAFALFTYWDAVISIPPVVSPMPPPVATVWTSCSTYSFDGQEIPPVFSPAPPPEEAVTYKGGAQAWFIGVGAYSDGIAIGDMYTNKAANYPQVTRTIGISQEIKVGVFLIEAYKGGFDLYVDCNELMPTSLYMCNNVLSFDTLLIGKP
jgi:hypothetical protein